MKAETVTDQMIERAEELCGMGHNAWDCVDPKEVFAACVTASGVGFKSMRLTRDEAEWLVALLEACDPASVGTWRHSIASEIRETFGMLPFKQK